MFEDVLQEGLNKGFRGELIPDERGEIEAFRVLNYLTQDSLKYLLEQLSREQVQFLKEHSDYKAWDTLGEKINQYEDTSKGHEWAESEVNNEALQILQVITKTFNVGKFELLKRGEEFSKPNDCLNEFENLLENNEKGGEKIATQDEVEKLKKLVEDKEK